MARVLVLGGGFGGLAAANELRAVLADEDEIVVVSTSDRFFMGFAKLWDLGRIRALDGGTRPLTALAGRGIRFHHAEVTAVEPASVAVSTSQGDLEADAMVVALGTVPVPDQLQMIAAGGGHNLYDARGLPAMHAALDGLTTGRVVVAILGIPFKCPPAPYEAALLVDERLRARGVRDGATAGAAADAAADVVADADVAVDVVTPQPMTLPAAGPDASRMVAEYLAERNIGLHDRTVVTGVDPASSELRFESGETLDCSVLLAVPAEKVPAVLESSPLVGPSGFVEPDRATLRTHFPRVYAVGDCTMVPTATAQLPKAGVFAAAQGRVAARNIATDLHGRDGASFDGHGMCFLEFPGRTVAMVEGNFFAEPKPDVRLTEATEVNFERKQAYERERLAEWLG